MLTRRNGIKTAAALSLTTLLSRSAAQAEEAETLAERAAELIADATYAEVMALAYISIDFLSVWIKSDLPRTLTSREVLASGQVDIEALRGMAATSPVERALVEALLATV